MDGDQFCSGNFTTGPSELMCQNFQFIFFHNILSSIFKTLEITESQRRTAIQLTLIFVSSSGVTFSGVANLQVQDTGVKLYNLVCQ